MSQAKTYEHFDGFNFAARVRCPVLIGPGLIDETTSLSGIHTAANQLKGMKEVVVFINSDHQGTNKTQVPCQARAAQEQATLLPTGRTNLKENLTPTVQ